MMRGTAIGLDINDTNICAVELRATARGLQLVRSATGPTPVGSVDQGSIVQPKAVARAVRGLLRSGHINGRGRPVVVSLGGAAVVTRVSQLPPGGPSAIQEGLQEEIKRYAVFKGDATISDFAVFNSPQGQQGGRCAFLAAVREETAGRLVETVMRAGLEPAVIDVSSLASARPVYSRHLAPQDSTTVVLAAVESESVHLIVVQGGTIVFAHTAAGAVNILEEATGGALDLASEVRSVMDFYDTEMGSRNSVRKVVVCVSEDVPEDFAGRLSQALDGISVEVTSPSSIAKDAGLLDDGRHGRPTPCAVGLAMRAIGDGAFPLSLDLLPEATVRVQTLKKRALVTAILAAFLFLSAVLFMGAIHLRVRALESEITNVQRSLARITVPASAQQTKAEVAMLLEELEEREAFLDLAGIAIGWSKLLSDIKRRIPKDVRLTALVGGSFGELALEGESFSVGSVYRFAALLGDSEFIESAKVAYLEVPDSSEDVLPTYEIDCQLCTPGEKGK